MTAPLIEVGWATDVGGRSENQDRCAVSPRWAIVSDGLGRPRRRGHSRPAGCRCRRLPASLRTAEMLERRCRRTGGEGRQRGRARRPGRRRVRRRDVRHPHVGGGHGGQPRRRARGSSATSETRPAWLVTAAGASPGHRGPERRRRPRAGRQHHRRRRQAAPGQARRHPGDRRQAAVVPRRCARPCSTPATPSSWHPTACRSCLRTSPGSWPGRHPPKRRRPSSSASPSRTAPPTTSRRQSSVTWP